MARAVLAEGRFLRFVNVDGWEFVERANCHDVVSIIAATDAGEVLLVEQYRPTMHARVIELPAGLAGDGGTREELTATAERELLEETGYRPEGLRLAVAGPSSTGLTNEVISYYVADRVTREGDGGGVEGESITTHAVPLATIDAWLAQRQAAGVMVDPRVYIGLYFLARQRQPKED